MTNARVETVVDTVFGHQLADPYRWMERNGPELRDWLLDQGKAAEQHFAGLPRRDELLARLDELTKDSVDLRGFSMAGDRVFFLRQTGDVPALVVREGGEERVLLDPATFEGDEHSNIDWYSPSPDGALVACGISLGGSEQSQVSVLDVATGELTPTTLRNAMQGNPAWLPDGSGFVCHCYPVPDPALPPARRRDNSVTWFQPIGSGEPTVVARRGHNPSLPMAPIDRAFVLLPATSELMFAVVSHAAVGDSITEQMSAFTLYAAPRSGLGSTATCQWRKIADPSDDVTGYAVHGDTLYVITHKDAPRAEIQAWSLTDGARRTVVPGGDRAVLGVEVVGEHLLVRDVDAGTARLRRIPLAGGEIEDVPLPAGGTIQQWTAHADGRSALIVFSSWTQSPTAYRYDGRLHDTGWIPPSPVDFGGIEVTQLSAPARDGALIPLTVLHRKGIVLDGGNPTLLTGYGSYGYVVPRSFNPRLLPWLERGGVYALAGLRGGGDHGDEWHLAGRLLNKENTITDLVDCAEHLVAAGYTRPERLAGSGGSAGGIPTGGAIVRRPDLWAAMVMEVAVSNTTRMEFTDNGPINTPEFGSVATEEGLAALLIADGYLRVEDGVEYPAVLLTVGLNDPRVPAWQPAKMAARLQAATASDRPVLLRVEVHGGHGFGATRAQRNAETADIYAFVASRTGLS
ncbi:prolyl oligopeptidase family serine peptidase [Kutzneria sp. CA-103260]|uniref:prolyl oligopeptidase family serine peptidase n=1 Tax=Kutzneria sp. CA-103260 TaxID=2802641 RepID=UPI001BA7C15A|nr:prolyl oligopeptidase family serine peptidase [Kutzneria sp. CA-103260]QUQ68582.1 S9 family peptidase [Kutzneria sp. CA-103260]